jgi:hypothetical protein
MKINQQIIMESLISQALSIDAAEGTACIFSILSCCSKDLGVQGIARIACSSKSLNKTCVAIVRRDALQLLEAAAAQAAEGLEERHAAAATATAAMNDPWWPAMHWRRCVELEQAAQAVCSQRLNAVAWLLQTAPTETTSGAAVECVLSMPAVTQQAAVQLVKAGMRVSYAQLLSAADRMVEGVEVWVVAQQQLGVQMDIPEDAVDVCTGDSSMFKRWVSWHSAAVP